MIDYPPPRLKHVMPSLKYLVDLEYPPLEIKEEEQFLQEMQEDQ